MLPTINGKAFLDCSLEDLRGILDNQDYREGDYLDYKKSFELTEIPKSEKDAVNKAKAEFRKDVCAFANARGGYLIYGIKEDGKAVPHELVGITISDNNTEMFENTVKNTLQIVSPRIPHFEIQFIACGNDKFVVVLYIHHDFFSPYVFLENNQDYRVYKRVGNSVRVVTYEEMKTMFSQSITLEKEIERYRKERINLFYDQEATYHEDQFMLMHMIPETFLDSSYNNPIYYFARKGTRFGELFSPFRCDIRLIPTAAGIRYANQEYGTECRLQNNGIAEIYCPLKDYIRITEEAQKGALYTMSLWEDIERFVRAYAGKRSLLANDVRVFAGLSVVGCKDVKTDNGWPKAGSIERHMLVCEPVVFEDMADSTRLEHDIKRLKLETLLSLGAQAISEISQLLAEVYENEN